MVLWKMIKYTLAVLDLLLLSTGVLVWIWGKIFSDKKIKEVGKLILCFWILLDLILIILNFVFGWYT